MEGLIGIRPALKSICFEHGKMYLHLKDGRIVIIEINPRTSRSSALASKATGFPIARVAAQLAVGIHLSEIPYYRLGTLDKYTPYGDYIVVKFPRFAFEKFPEATDILGTQMKAVGESMSIGKSFKEAMQKAIRSLENGRHGLGFANNFNDLAKEELMEKPRNTPTVPNPRERKTIQRRYFDCGS